jgi:hypothetical protein
MSACDDGDDADDDDDRGRNAVTINDDDTGDDDTCKCCGRVPPTRAILASRPSNESAGTCGS